MACLLVPATEALVVTAVEKVVEKKESKNASDKKKVTEKKAIPLSRKLKWLTWMLWGGALLLLFEHVWHGEIVPFFPFLTAMNDKEDTREMLHEMATVGVTMAVLTTAIWIVICKVCDSIVKRPAAKTVSAK